MHKLSIAVVLSLFLAGCSARCIETRWVKEGAPEEVSIADWRAAWQQTADVRAAPWEGMDVYALNEWNRAVLVHRRNAVEARMRAAGYEKLEIEGCERLKRPAREDLAAR